MQDVWIHAFSVVSSTRVRSQTKRPYWINNPQGNLAAAAQKDEVRGAFLIQNINHQLRV